MKRNNISLIASLLFSLNCFAQISTSEDSLSVGGKKPATYLGGYGNVLYQHNRNEIKSQLDLERTVIFLGHRFNDKFSFVSEIEIEDAKVSGGEEGGEVAVEQAYLKFNVSRNSYMVAGLFLPRIGILNENHLPNAFNGNERTIIETVLIPSTWREIGVGFYTRLNALPIDISLGLVNGLNSEGFVHGSLIREGRYEGKNASAKNMAVTGAIQYNKNNLTFQLSGYAGGSVGLSPKEADTLGLKTGPFGTPVILGEADVQYRVNAFSLKVLGTIVSIPDANSINNAYINNTPESAYGYYFEAAYDLLYKKQSDKKRSLICFARYEKFDLNATIPSNGIPDATMDQHHIIAGVSYLPIPQIAIKFDVRSATTGEQNPVLVINPDPNNPYKKHNTFINVGFGFSF